MTGVRRFLCVLAVLVVFRLPGVAVAAWPLASAAPVLLGYGETYDRDDGSAVHRGIDLGCEEGANVLAPEGGCVTFAGFVPGQTGRILAVTVESDQGLLVTCMPFETLDVIAGQTVESGDVLGVLASTGDPSTAASHLHVSVRRGSAYLDPASTIGSAPEPEANEVADSPVAETVTELPPAPIQAGRQGAPDATAVQSDVSVAADSIVSVEHEPAGAVRDAAPVSRPTAVVTDEIAVLSPAPQVAQAAVPASEPHAQEALQLIEQESVRTVRANGGSDSPESSGAARSYSRLLAPVIAGVCVGAIGLWPLWRPGIRSVFMHGVRPILDDVAAAVGR